jgi:hypothetical protein
LLFWLHGNMWRLIKKACMYCVFHCGCRLWSYIWLATASIRSTAKNWATPWVRLCKNQNKRTKLPTAVYKITCINVLIGYLCYLIYRLTGKRVTPSCDKLIQLWTARCNLNKFPQ